MPGRVTKLHISDFAPGVLRLDERATVRLQATPFVQVCGLNDMSPLSCHSTPISHSIMTIGTWDRAVITPP